MFDQSTVNKIAADIKKIANWKKESYGNQSFDYTEHRFGDGSGGFSFKWAHARNWGGQIGLTFGKDGNHKYYSYSWYDKKYTGSATHTTRKPSSSKVIQLNGKTSQTITYFNFGRKLKARSRRMKQEPKQHWIKKQKLNQTIMEVNLIQVE